MAAIYLKFKRTIASTWRCTFPHCAAPLNQLRNVKRSERIKAFTWEFNSEGEMFTKKQIEDLITLASNNKIKIERSG